MGLLTGGFIKKNHLNRFIDKTFGSYYGEVYARDASGHKLPIGFAQKSGWTVISLDSAGPLDFISEFRIGFVHVLRRDL